jgi:hypothetical protein
MDIKWKRRGSNPYLANCDKTYKEYGYTTKAYHEYGKWQLLVSFDPKDL